MFILLTLLALSLILIFCSQKPKENKENSDGTGVRTGETVGATEEISQDHLMGQMQSVGYSPTDPAVLELFHQLLRDSVPLKIRRQAIRSLAKSGSDQALLVLKTAMQKGTPYLRASIGEGLGECTHPEARGLLAELANDAEETAARGAIRGMARRGDAEAIDLLARILFDPYKPESVRTEAALALGDIPQPAALSLLARAANESQDDTITESVLQGLGRRPFDETANFFQSYLESPANSIESKTAALEALGQVEGERGQILLNYLADPNPQLRAAAAWSLSTLDSPTDFGLQLVDLLKQEPDAEVRRRLYQALANQESFDWPSVAALARSESEPIARLAAFDLLAGACRSASLADLLDFFHERVLPEIKEIALHSGSAEERLTAAITLRRAGTAQSFAVLQDLAKLSNDSKVVEATRAAIGTQDNR